MKNAIQTAVVATLLLYYLLCMAHETVQTASKDWAKQAEARINEVIGQ